MTAQLFWHKCQRPLSKEPFESAPKVKGLACAASVALMLTGTLVLGTISACEQAAPTSGSKGASSTKAVAGSQDHLAREGLDQLYGLFNDFRMTDDWSRAKPTLLAIDGREIDGKLLPLMGIYDGEGFGFHILRNGRVALMFGINTKSNAAALLLPRTALTSDEIAQMVGERIELKKIGETSDIGQHCKLYAAWLGAEPLGMVSITISNGIENMPNTASVGILDWRSAIAVDPKIKGILLRQR